MVSKLNAHHFRLFNKIEPTPNNSKAFLAHSYPLKLARRENYQCIEHTMVFFYVESSFSEVKYVYKFPELTEDVLVYNFRTIDVQKVEFENKDRPLDKFKYMYKCRV